MNGYLVNNRLLELCGFIPSVTFLLENCVNDLAIHNMRCKKTLPESEFGRI